MSCETILLAPYNCAFENLKHELMGLKSFDYRVFAIIFFIGKPVMC